MESNKGKIDVHILFEVLSYGIGDKASNALKSHYEKYGDIRRVAELAKKSLIVRNTELQSANRRAKHYKAKCEEMSQMDIR